jgi:uncharacterized membrane protein YccC
MRDQALASVRRAARVTLVACLGFYTCRYWLDNPTMATYALFGTIAMGVLAQIPGPPAERARTLLAILPVGYLLVTAGTLLSVSTWSAVAGTFVFGFLISYAGVGGPRLVGMGAGVQLLYILPCFPPYDPGELGYRLAGLTIAVVPLAVAERVLWPDPAPVPYRTLLAGAFTPAAACLLALADQYEGDRRGRHRFVPRMDDAARAAEVTVPSRPVSASRRDRALSQAGGLLRLVLGAAVDLFRDADWNAQHRRAVGGLLREAASTAEAAAQCLRGAGAPPDTTPLDGALETFRRTRLRSPPDAAHPDRLRAGSLALALGEWTRAAANAVRVAAGAPADQPADPAWYAGQPAARLWWRRFRDHLTPRSVYFQGALRLAVALAAARYVAGVLDLSHGFWVLLATLTVLRTSALETRMALWPALAGTVVGSALAGGLLLLGADPHLYEVALPVVMLGGLTAGPLLGLGWSQAVFTLVISLVFAQLTPVNWQLAATRVIDVAVGTAIGALLGLVAWPRGSTGELHHATARFLAASAAVVRQTVAAVAAATPAGTALPQARHQGQLAEASYALYQNERHDPPVENWPAVLHTGHRAVGGADVLLRPRPPDRPLSCHRRLTAYAEAVAAAYERLAAHRGQARPVLAPADPGGWPTDLGPDLYRLTDLRVWLDGLSTDLNHAAGSSPVRRAGGVPRR